MIKIISSLIVALPEIIKLIKNIQKEIDAQKTNKKVKDDIRKINQAFEIGNAQLLNDVFNGTNFNGLREQEKRRQT